MKFKINSTGEIILADLAFMEEHHADNFTEVVVNHTVVISAKSWPAFDFYRKFTSQERIAIRSRAKTDPVVEDIYATLNAAVASGANVRDDDPDTVQGLTYLEGIGDLAQGRAAEILS